MMLKLNQFKSHNVVFNENEEPQELKINANLLRFCDEEEPEEK